MANSAIDTIQVGGTDYEISDPHALYGTHDESAPNLTDNPLYVSDIATTQQNDQTKPAGANVAYEMQQQINTINSNFVYSTSHVPNDITSRLGNLSKAIAEQNLEKYGYKIGDYFLGTGSTPYVYWLADLNTFYGGYNSYAVLSTPHVGVVVDTKLASKWNDSVVAYKDSTLHSLLTGTVLAQIKTDITARLGTWSSHMLAHDKLYNAIGTWAWSSSNTRSEYISALTESQFYGAPIWSVDAYQQGEGDKKLTIFDLFKYNRILGNISIWLRSIASSSWACFATINGYADRYAVTASLRVAGLILIY